jgi:membrane protease YdiL (CAAX protease family)
MDRFMKYMMAVVPYLAAETIQYILFLIITSISSRAEISDRTMYTLYAGIIAVCGILFFFWYRYEIRGEIRGSLKNIVSVKCISLFILLGIGCQFFFTGLMSLIEPLFTEVFADYSETLESLSSGNTVVVLFLMIVIAPVTEELIFRGVTLHKANRQIAFWGANILQAVLFGIYHWNIVQGVYATLLGILLGAVYYKYRTIFAPILLHMLINASSLLAVFIPDTTLSYVIIMAAGGGCIATSLLIIKPAHRVTLQTLSGIQVQESR